MATKIPNHNKKSEKKWEKEILCKISLLTTPDQIYLEKLVRVHLVEGIFL